VLSVCVCVCVCDVSVSLSLCLSLLSSSFAHTHTHTHTHTSAHYLLLTPAHTLSLTCTPLSLPSHPHISPPTLTRAPSLALTLSHPAPPSRTSSRPAMPRWRRSSRSTPASRTFPGRRSSSSTQQLLRRRSLVSSCRLTGSSTQQLHRPG
jgi:hypothetical protein